MGSVRIGLALVAACALAVTLAFLAVSAPAASQQHAAAAVYCPDKNDRAKDLAKANAAVKSATANVSARTRALAKATKAHNKKAIAAAQKALRTAKARLADAKQAQKDAKAALAECD